MDFEIILQVYPLDDYLPKLLKPFCCAEQDGCQSQNKKFFKRFLLLIGRIDMKLFHTNGWPSTNLLKPSAALNNIAASQSE